MYAKNNKKEYFVVEFNVEGTGFTTDKSNNKVKVVVKPLAKQELITITPTPGSTTSYSMGFKYYPGTMVTTTAGDGSIIEKEESASITMDELNKGITLFSKDGCGRCTFAAKYLTENKIVYKEVNISKNKADQRVMWEVLEKAGMQGTSVQTPVIVVDGKVNYQVSDLQSFLVGLKR
jgi:glutaredoxin